MVGVWVAVLLWVGLVVVWVGVAGCFGCCDPAQTFCGRSGLVCFAALGRGLGIALGPLDGSAARELEEDG